MTPTRTLLALLPMALASFPAAAQEAAPSYDKDVQPLFRKYCMPCHDAKTKTEDLDLSTYEGLMKGGEHGPVIVPGRSGASRLVLLVDGKKQPKMPPSGKAPSRAEIDRLKAWIDAGAKKDEAKAGSSRAPATVAGETGPPPRMAARGQIAAVAFSPDGRTLAVGGYREVLLADAYRGTRLRRLTGPTGVVTALAFAPDGRTLVAAGGAPGQFGEITVWGPTSPGPSRGGGAREGRSLRAHGDAIYSIAFSPDGQTLAAGSYDRRVSLWHAPFRAGSAPRICKDHTDAVYAVAFSPDGRRVASAAGDRTVKLWDAASGKRLFTLTEATAELYSVAFHPSGRELAAGGADKSVRVWSLGWDGGTPRRSIFAHDGAVVRLLYTPDGSRIATAGEDRAIKLWHSGSLTETRVLPKQPDWPLALALSPDGRRLAAGRYDGSLSLYDLATGRVIAAWSPSRPASRPGARTRIGKRSVTGNPSPKAAVPRAATNPDGKPTRVPAALRSLTPLGATRGGRVRFTLRGVNLSDATGVFFDDPAITGRVLNDALALLKRSEVTIEATIGPAARVGVRRIFLQTPMGTTGSLPFAVGGWPERSEAEPNDTLDEAQPIAFPSTIVGTLGRTGDEDHFVFEARAGQELVFQVVAAAVGSPANGVLSLLDARGRLLAEVNDLGSSLDPVLGYRFEHAGCYVLRLRDFEGGGSDAAAYRLNAGEFPYVTGVFPLGVRRGGQSEIALRGLNLGAAAQTTVHGPATPRDASPWCETVHLSVATTGGELLNDVRLAVTGEPEHVEQESASSTVETRNDTPATAARVPIPVTIDGRIAGASADGPDADCFRFRARKGERLVLEVAAQRFGSRLDSFLEVLDASGRPIERALLRCVAETVLVLSDRDSASGGFRIQSWVDLGVGDFVFAGRELLRVARLPNGPDDDIAFETLRGRRVGLLDTTPEHHSVGSPVYKVTVHPAGARLTPNGMPLFRLYSQNDDGGPLYGKDSRLTFDPPADGDYVVRLTDAQGREGDDLAYRLTIRPPRPDFCLRMSPENPNVPRGGSVPVEVTAERLDGFDGPIAVRIDALPAGVSADPAIIPAGGTSATLILTARADAPSIAMVVPQPARVTGSARIGGRLITRATTPEGGMEHRVTLLPAPDVTVRTDRREVTLRPGGQVDVTAEIARHHGFGGRVPIEVRNLPSGVRVLDVGLNGVLVTETETSRRFVLMAEPWAPPVTRPFYAVARVESDPPSLIASPPVLLRVSPQQEAARLSDGRGRARLP
jgi:WD40 repeat protein